MSKRTWHKIFASYRQLILVVSEISFKLYSKNQIIFKQKDFQPLFDEICGDKSIKPIANGFLMACLLTRQIIRMKNLCINILVSWSFSPLSMFAL